MARAATLRCNKKLKRSKLKKKQITKIITEIAGYANVTFANGSVHPNTKQFPFNKSAQVEIIV